MVLCAAVLALSQGLIWGEAARAAGGPEVAYTIGKYPVEAIDNDAVAAKDKAIADGQQAALRSLLKRIVPVTHYARINRIQPAPRAIDFIDGVAVQSERNSSTRYIASLDFSFRAQPVRDLLRKQGIPYVDSQSQPVGVLPVFRSPAEGAGTVADGARHWMEAWQVLDHEHALTPLRLAARPPQVPPATVDGVIAGDAGMQRLLSREYGIEQAIVAVAEPDPSTHKVTVTIAGRDAVGQFSLKRVYRYADGDLAYTLELASVVSLGVLEGRWKALRMRGVSTGSLSAAPLAPVQLFVEYSSLDEWSELRETIASTPGVEEFRIGGVAPRGADVAVLYPGGATALAQSLRGEGLEMQEQGGLWQVRRRGG